MEKRCLPANAKEYHSLQPARATEFQHPDRSELFCLRAALIKAHFCTVQASTTKLRLCQSIKSTQRALKHFKHLRDIMRLCRDK